MHNEKATNNLFINPKFLFNPTYSYASYSLRGHADLEEQLETPYFFDEGYEEEDEEEFVLLPGFIWFFNVCLSVYGVFTIIERFSDHQINKANRIVNARDDLVNACSDIAKVSPEDRRELCYHPKVIAMTNEIFQGQNLNIICDRLEYTPTNLGGISVNRANSWARAGVIRIVEHDSGHNGFFDHKHENSNAIYSCDDSKGYCSYIAFPKKKPTPQHSHSFKNGSNAEFLKCKNIRLIR